MQVSRHLALYGAHVYMLNRKEDQGDDAIEKIQAEAKEQGKVAKIEWVGPFDLGTLSEVQKVLGDLISKLDRLDYLILSAGINSNQYGQTNDGLDRHFEVNALGHYFTINQLYPLLRKTSKLPGTKKGSVRIVFESSEMHRFAPPSTDSVERKRGVHFASEEEITEGAKVSPDAEDRMRLRSTRDDMLIYVLRWSICATRSTARLSFTAGPSSP